MLTTVLPQDPGGCADSAGRHTGTGEIWSEVTTACTPAAGEAPVAEAVVEVAVEAITTAIAAVLAGIGVGVVGCRALELRQGSCSAGFAGRMPTVRSGCGGRWPEHSVASGQLLGSAGRE